MDVQIYDELSHETYFEEKEICISLISESGDSDCEIPEKDPLAFDIEMIKKEQKVFDGEIYPSTSHDCMAVRMSPPRVLIKEELIIKDDNEVDFDPVKAEIYEDSPLSPVIMEVKELEPLRLSPCNELSTPDEKNIARTDSPSRVDHRIEINKCNDGNNRFEYSNQSKTPKVSHNSENHFICNHCHKSFLDLRNLESEIVTQAGHKVYTCDNCQKSITIFISLKENFGSQIGKERFICKICDREFSDPTSLKRHLRTHTGDRPFICKLCNRGFSDSTSLTKHYRTHTREKPFICKICYKGFSHSSNLTIHLCTHTGGKPFICKMCNKGFSQFNHFKTHQRTHTGEKPII